MGGYGQGGYGAGGYGGGGASTALEVGFVALLLADPYISALVGGRIYPVILPPNQGAAPYPALTYQLVGGSSEPTFETSGFTRRRVQFDCWGQKYGDASNLRQTLVQVLNGYRGALPDGTFLEDAEYIQPIDFFEHDVLLYRCAVEFYFYFDLPRT